MSVTVFFSYAHEDEDLRDKLANHLRTLEREGVISAWHDREIGAGQEWSREIEQRLEAAQIILLLVSSDFIASDQLYDTQLKRAMERHETGEACVIPVIVRPVDWQGTPLGKLKALPSDGKAITTWENQDAAFLDVAQGIRRVARGGSLAEEPGMIECPYQGVFAFQEADAPFFFGREVFVQELGAAVRAQPLVAVVGPSGSGKSSAVFAGLFPQLRSEGNWLLAAFRPKERPLYELAAVLVRLLEPEESRVRQERDADDLVTDLRQGKSRLGTLTARILDNHPQCQRLLLLIDQFEELYTLCRDPEERQCFLDELLTVCGPPNSPSSEVTGVFSLRTRGAGGAITLVFTLRADFYGYVLSYRPLTDALRQADVKLGPMTQAELQAAIEQPAQKLGVQLEAGLTQRILDEVGQEPGNLPLLEFALTLLWQKQRFGQLTHRVYDEIGGVAKALANHAEEVYSQLTQPERRQAQRIFLQLVQPGEGTEDTRRLATRAEVGEAQWDLVTYLAGARLVVTGRSEAASETVEVVHEALIREWGQLREWMVADRAFRTWQERLRAAMRQWQMSHHDEGALLRGAPLAEAEDWLRTRPADLSEPERIFIQTSVTLHNREQAERKHRQQQITLGLTGGLVMALMLLGVTGWKWQEAEVGQIKELSASSEALFSSHQEFNALIAGLKAGTRLQSALWSRADPQIRAQLMTVLGQSVYGVSERNRLEGFSSWVNGVNFSPDGKTLAAAYEDQKIRLWGLDGQLLKTLSGHTAGVTDVSFSADGQTLASSSKDNTIQLWNLQDGRLLKTLKGHKDWIYGVSFSPNGQTLASGSNDNTIKLWNVQDGRLLKTLKGHGSGVISVSFSPDGRILASTSYDYTIKLWNLQDGQLIKTLASHSAGVTGVSFSPNGKTLVSASYDYTIKVWNLEEQLKILKGHTYGVSSVSFSADGKTIASASLDATVKFWSINGQLLRTFIGHSYGIHGVSFSPDGRTLASASQDNTIKLWSVDGQLLKTLKGHSNTVYSVSFSPDGRTLASGSEDNTIKLWSVDGQLLKTLGGHSAGIISVSFSPDGKTLASASADHTVKLWRPENGQLLQTLTGQSAEVQSISFSPDGRTLASASADGTVKLWQLEDGQSLRTFKGHGTWVYGVSFSPDAKTLASASADRTVKLWSIENGQLLKTLKGHSDWVYGVSFSPDGQTLASASEDKTVILWDLKSLEFDELLVRGCNWIRDYLKNNSNVSTEDRHLCDRIGSQK